jgi:hypothetical protein
MERPGGDHPGGGMPPGPRLQTNAPSVYAFFGPSPTTRERAALNLVISSNVPTVTRMCCGHSGHRLAPVTMIFRHGLTDLFSRHPLHRNHEESGDRRNAGYAELFHVRVSQFAIGLVDRELLFRHPGGDLHARCCACHCRNGQMVSATAEFRHFGESSGRPQIAPARRPQALDSSRLPGSFQRRILKASGAPTQRARLRRVM